MYCKNCGVKNEENARFCENCGMDLFADNKSKPKVNKNFLIGLIVTVIIIMGIVLVQFIKGLPLKEDKIIENFKENVFAEREENISEIKVISRVTDDTADNIVVQIICDNGAIQYTEKYAISYYKDREWKLMGIDDYEKDTWEKHPIKAPTSEEMFEKSKSYFLEDYNGISFDTFDISTTKEEFNSEEETAKYYYKVTKDTLLKDSSGEVIIYYEFDADSESWEYEEYQYADSYTVSYELSYVWEGKKESNWYGDKTFKIKNVVKDGENVTIEFIEDGSSHKMSGVIDGLYIEVFDVTNDGYCIKGEFDEETGEFDGTLYREYSPDKTVYFGSSFDYLYLSIIE